MLTTILGIDHAMIVVRDLDAAAADWAAAGFTLSPRGLHSEAMGSANYTIMFGEDYVELLGVVAPTPRNEGVRNFLAGRQGFARTAFTTTDAAAGAAALKVRGIEAVGPMDFARPVPLPGGAETEARFSVFQWPETLAPGAMRIFACQHHTRNAVWIPDLQRHANGVAAIRRALVASPDPAAAAAGMAALIESAVETDGAISLVPTGTGRADFAFATRADLAAAYGLDAASLPDTGGAGLVLGATTARAPMMVTGCALVFEPL
ncbi:VOC family protein [Plastoroseomonas arctica]|uniref:VOC family protein n=1 Tax=Plastoroseomonas arctica TaxID=1509237 RepID=A0AAF1K1X8_9PROT|nr:VOC family protein [Plastoroseomonas arctica]MBR0655368.1 VOC family protein [Plastoroseomonas arctica]